MSDIILKTVKLGFQWPTIDPFLFCVHHNDNYPRGNEHMGPDASLAGRNIGSDFEGKDGWRMYHGDVVPGFPKHPHRGFETVTIVRRGLIDHSDSLGATARFGEGDVQWLTAGAGISHCEMFPLLNKDAENPAELFQIWLNLPRKSKFAPPHFTMLWNEKIPRVEVKDEQGRRTNITVIAGAFGDAKPLNPPPDSWASNPDSHLAIWTLRMEPNASFVVPATDDPDVMRAFYFFDGASLKIGAQTLNEHVAAIVHSDEEALLVAGDTAVDILMLQAKPIGEPVVQYGPFVMNTREEIQRAFDDYRRTEFGGWPWHADDPVHPRAETRFAKHADGRIERAENA